MEKVTDCTWFYAKNTKIEHTVRPTKIVMTAFETRAQGPQDECAITAPDSVIAVSSSCLDKAQI